MKWMELGLRALNKLGLLAHLNFSVPLTLSGKRTRIPMRKAVGFTYLFVGDSFMDTLIARALPIFPGVFVDVGVNIGQTIIRLRNAFPDVPVVGFEPNPVCVEYTQQLIALNGYRNVRLIPAALAEEVGQGSLLLWESWNPDDSTATLVKDFRPVNKDQKEIPVLLTTWGDVERKAPIGKLGFVKIDVEGGELEVLRSMGPRIAADRPLVVVEVLPTHDPPRAGRRERHQAVEQLAQEWGYRIYRIHKQGVDARLQAIETFGIWSDLRTADHLLVPSDRTKDILRLFAATDQ